MIKNVIFNSRIEVTPGNWGVWGNVFLDEETNEVIGFRCEDRNLKHLDWGYGEFYAIEKQNVVNKGHGWQGDTLADTVEEFETLEEAENFLKELIGDEATEEDNEAISYDLNRYETEDGEIVCVEVLDVRYMKK
jgi:hypothetical protein